MLRGGTASGSVAAEMAAEVEEVEEKGHEEEELDDEGRVEDEGGGSTVAVAGPCAGAGVRDDAGGNEGGRGAAVASVRASARIGVLPSRAASRAGAGLGPEGEGQSPSTPYHSTTRVSVTEQEPAVRNADQGQVDRPPTRWRCD